jgi:hypothetical protein
MAAAAAEEIGVDVLAFVDAWISPKSPINFSKEGKLLHDEDEVTDEVGDEEEDVSDAMRGVIR